MELEDLLYRSFYGPLPQESQKSLQPLLLRGEEFHDGARLGDQLRVPSEVVEVCQSLTKVIMDLELAWKRSALPSDVPLDRAASIFRLSRASSISSLPQATTLASPICTHKGDGLFLYVSRMK